LQGEQYGDTARALRNGEIDRTTMTAAEVKLMEFVETVTRHAYRVTPELVEEVKAAGWSDEQIAEAVYDTALFNLFVRLADSFGIEPPPLYEPEGIPPVVRE
jgi:alkylhydroperoxidase family enzyme